MGGCGRSGRSPRYDLPTSCNLVMGMTSYLGVCALEKSGTCLSLELTTGVVGWVRWFVSVGIGQKSNTRPG